MSARAVPKPSTDGEFRIASATGVAVQLRLAGPGARALAFVLDWLARVVLAAGWYLGAAALYHGRLSLAAPMDADTRWFACVLAPAAAIYFLYHFVLECALRGSTPGKRAAGIRIATREGGTPSLGALLIRNVFRLIDALPLLYSFGLTSLMLTRDHVRIGDLAAGTVLVYERTAAEPPAPADLEPAAASSPRGAALLARAGQWPAAARRAARLRDSAAADPEEAWQLIEDYGALARDCASARALLPRAAGEFLETAYANAHAALHRGALHPARALLALFREEIPRACAALRVHLAWVSALFVLAIGAGFSLVHAYPDLIALFASPEMIAAVERGELWTRGLLSVAPAAVISVQILTNNIVVSLFAFCAGFLFGLGTFYIVALNGLTLGAVFAFTAHHGIADRLFGFILPHGCVELSVMCLSGAAGAAVGEALARPGALGRRQAFELAALRSGYVLVACVVLLIGCGLIEGYVSPDPAVPLAARALIGVGYWLFMFALLTGALFGRPPWRARGVASESRSAIVSPNGHGGAKALAPLRASAMVPALAGKPPA